MCLSFKIIKKENPTCVLLFACWLDLKADIFNHGNKIRLRPPRPRPRPLFLLALAQPRVLCMLRNLDAARCLLGDDTGGGEVEGDVVGVANIAKEEKKHSNFRFSTETQWGRRGAKVLFPSSSQTTRMAQLAWPWNMTQHPTISPSSWQFHHLLRSCRHWPGFRTISLNGRKPFTPQRWNNF